MSKSTRTPEPTDNQGEIVEEQLGGGSASPGTKATTRRKLLQIGAGLAAVTGLPRGLGTPAIAQSTMNVPKAPNIVVLMTDQERHHRHWPDGWAEKNLPSLQRLKRHGL
jgi:choline-sulfatase